MSDSSLRNLHQAITSIYQEIREEGSEFDFRYSLVDHLFTDALGWSRTQGEGHVNFEDDRKDLLFYDDSEPPFPVIICETKSPSHNLDLDDVEQLETYMNGVGSAKYGVLTNGHEFRFYEYISESNNISGIDGFNVDSVATSEFEDLSNEQQNALNELVSLHHNRYVEFDDVEYFRETYQEVPVQYQPGTDDEGYDLFLEAIKNSLDELTDVLIDFFSDYRSRDTDSYPHKFLDSTFSDWKEWREYTGRSDNAKETFCRETAYIILNRSLFARIAEDKEIVGHTRLSFRGMADELEREEDQPYLDALIDTYDRIDDHYPDLYELGIFDWWWVSKDKRGQFSKSERRKQRGLEDNLNYSLRKVIKRLNRFNFGYVNRDILGHVYEDYLPKSERKELGEYYTPLEVVQFMLDSVDYRSDEGIGRKKILDPACGSGTFLTEVVERLIQHFLGKFNKTSVHRLDAEEARIILERIEENVYGIDINPFAAHISQINLLFRTIDLYDKVTEKDPYYTMDGFEIHVADTLTPTLREQNSGSSDDDTKQSGLEQFAGYNGRAQSFIEDRNAVDRIKDEMDFDVIVANPPYVSTQNMRPEAKSQYIEYYDDIESESTDIYIPFIERGYEWLSEDGRMTYICPDRLNTAEYGEFIRDSLVEKEITHIIQFKDTQVFDVSTPYPMIITINNQSPQRNHKIKCARFSKTKNKILDEINHLEEWSSTSPEYDLFYYKQSFLSDDNSDEILQSWKPMPKKEKKIFEKIKDNSDTRLQSVSDSIFQGIITGRDKIFLGEIIEKLNDNLVRFRPSGYKKDHIVEEAKIEKSLLKRILKGPDIDRWDADWKGLWAIFPYNSSGDTLSKNKLTSEYPNAWEYFSQHSDRLKGRRTSNWWDYSRKQNIKKIQQNKYIIRVNSDGPTITLDDDRRYIFVGSGGGSGGYGMLISAETDEELLYYGALLMSSVTEFYVEHISAIFGGKFYQYNERFLNPIPIVTNEESDTNYVSEISQNIIEKKREATELRYKTSDIVHYMTEYPTDSSLLDLSGKIELSGDNYRQDPIRTNDKMEVTSEEIYQVVMKRGHTMDFTDERVRDFVFMLLKAQDRRLDRSEILSMEVPIKENVLDLMNEYKFDRGRIDELEREAEELQDELDNVIVQDVYHLNDQDVTVMNDFLEVW